jgi:multidrug efflux pump subunit AcrA (membrane-fusion protein)
MKLSKLLVPGIILIALAAIVYFYNQPSADKQDQDLLTTVKKGAFQIKVTATGELKAKRSVKIRGPQGMRAAGIYETTISDLTTEGTILKEGDYVATLDRTELAGKMTNVQTEIEKIQTQLEQAKIDTAIELRGIRDQLINLGFTRKEKLLNVELNKYEPQSVIQQTQLDLERTERDYQQLLKNYELKKKQALAKIQEINALLRQNQNQMNIYSDLSNQFTITAPKEGMLIYARSWNGKKEPGSRVTAWDPVVAELPDLSDMISKTYVNEVDISKVKKGQDVKITIDAFPDNEYSGLVIQVANIGEQLRGYDAKVFEVVVQLNEVDSILRPAMTTSNEVITDIYQDVLFIPLEGLHSDSISFVYMKQGNKAIKQEVITGQTNDDEVIIEHGLEEGQEIFLTVPENTDNVVFQPIDPSIKEEIQRKQEEEAKKRHAQAMEKLKQVKDVDLPSPESGGEDVIIVFD